MASTHVN